MLQLQLSDKLETKEDLKCVRETTKQPSTELMLHLYFRSFHFPLVRFMAEAKNCWLVLLWRGILKICDKASSLLGMVVD